MTTHRQQQIKNAEKASNVNIILPIILLLLFLFAFIKNSKSQIVYVNSATTTGSNDGSTWADAYSSLQTAIENAPSASQIWVAQGTYKPNVYPIGTTDGSSTRDYSFTLRNNVAIYGGFVGTEPLLAHRNTTANPTILSGDIGVVGDASDNCYHVVLGDYINGTAVLDGFTIRDGNANASLITTHTPSGHILPSHSGAGMFLNFASPNINNCVITNNDATFAGGGVVAQGRSDEVFTNCVFANNRILTATFGGAGLYNYAHPSNPSYPTVTNCVFYNNISLGAGGAIYTQYSNMTITNTTIYNNTAQLWGGGIYNEDSSNMVIRNCIIWGNIGNAITQPAGSDAGLTWNAVEPTVTFSLLQSPSTYSSNISANPLFTNSSNPVGADGRWITADDGLRLSTCSPAIDAGTNSGFVMPLDIAALIRPQGGGVDMGAYETLLTSLVGTNRLYVNAAASGGIGNSWATAMNNLETALSTARTNTCIREIWVAQGTYKPSHQYSTITGNDTVANARYQTFNIPSGVAVYGGFIGTETALTSRPSPLLASILSGDIGVVDDSLDNSYHVVMFKNVLPTTRLDGFTITKGNANFDGIGGTTIGGGIFNECLGAGNSSNPTINNCSIVYNNALRFGAGMYNLGARFGICNPQITNCIVTNNNLSATYLGGTEGGGLYFEENTNGTCNPTITGCTISNNFANYGGAINLSYNTQATILNCNFLNNTARSGGAVYSTSQITINSAAFTNCIFTGNRATNNGGAIYNIAYSGEQNPSFTNCTFNNNIANNGGAFYNYSQVYNNQNNPIFNTCTFFNNNATLYGGAIYSNAVLRGSFNPVIKKSKFLSNTALYGGAVFIIQDSSSISQTICSQSIFDNNNSDYGAAFMAIATATSTINTAFSNCVFTRNNCVQSGGAIYLEARDNSTIHPNYEYCTFYNNHNSYGFAGIFNTREATSNNNPIYTNCIINQTAITNVVAGSSTAATPTFRFCNVEGSGGSSAWVASFGVNGGGNIDANPLFANTADLDGADNNWATNDDGLTLQPTSPCINTGSNSLATAMVDIIDNSRPIGTNVDMGAFETPLITTHSFSSSAGIGGSISPNGLTSVATGSDLNYTITPNTGFCINDVVVDGMSIGSVSTYTFTNVTTSHTIAVSFVASVTPAVTIVSSQNPICFGSSLTITATATNGGIAPMYNFYVDGVARGATASNSFSTSTLAAGSHTIYCVITANNICQTTATATSNIKTITVGNATILPSITGTTTLCSIAATSRLYNSVAGGVWSSFNAAVATINSSGVVTAVANGVTSITYTYTNSFGCVTTASANFNVAAIGAIAPISGASSVCVGSSITLSNATAGGVWSSIAGRATVSSTGVVTGTSSGSLAIIKYTIASSGCSSFVTKNITVNAIPATPSIGYAAPFSNPQRGAPTGGFCVGRVFGVAGLPSGGLWSTTGSIGVTTGGIATINTTGAGSLTYTFTAASGCSNSRTMTGTGFNCAARGIAKDQYLKTKDFVLFPNPAHSSVSLKVETLVGEGQIIVTDLYGKTVKSQPLSMGNNTVDVANLSKGMYFISTITSEGKTTKKLIVE